MPPSRYWSAFHSSHLTRMRFNSPRARSRRRASSRARPRAALSLRTAMAEYPSAQGGPANSRPEQALGGGALERGDRQALRGRLLQGAEAVLAGADHELQLVEVVGPREADELLALRGDLQAVHGEVEVPALQAGDEVLEVVVLED